MSFELTILGSNSAIPSKERYSTAHLLNVDEHFYLFDCAEGTQMQLKRFETAKFGKLNHIIISHLHGDHIFGLFGLLSTLELLGRLTPMTIIGPSRLEKIIAFYKQNFSHTNSFPVEVVPVPEDKAAVVYEDSKITLQSVPVTHSIPCFAYVACEKPRELNIKKEVFETLKLPISAIHKIKKGEDYIMHDGQVIPNEELTLPPFKQRKYAFFTDTLYKESILQYIQGADLFYHEATFLHKDLKRARQTCHTTGKQAGILAKKAGVEKLLIGHFSNRYKSIEPILDEAKEIFPETYAVYDGQSFKVAQNRLPRHI